MTVREYMPQDLEQILAIWNEIIEAGNAFAEEAPLNLQEADTYFSAQSYTGVAEQDGRIEGVYILHPNYSGRLGHICNASYAVAPQSRGQHVGELLVTDCMEKARALGFRILQFNAVVECNTPARRLYERLGFIQAGTIPCGFRMKDGHYETICIYYHIL